LINGFIIIDKPAGLTSHDIVNRVRRIFGTRKVGHTGTLDPFATGVLPVAVNEGTKAIPFLDEGLKCYEAVMRLGVVTDTLDLTGKVLREADISAIDKELFEAVLNRFTGRISQTPPMFSAIKMNGQPLYKLARQGQEVERQPREIEIRSLELISFEPPLAGIRVVCSRGTYIRSLADDIGSELACGAVLQELRRTASGSFEISSAVTLENLEEAGQLAILDRWCISPYAALSHMPDIPLSDAGLEKAMHGISPAWNDTALPVPMICQTPLLVRLSHNGVLVAVSNLVPEINGPARIAIKRVFV
jgi:tRNA pseudouridine55 synthase